MNALACVAAFFIGVVVGVFGLCAIVIYGEDNARRFPR